MSQTEQPILLDAGSGGRATHRLIADLFVRHFDNPILRSGDDAALLVPATPRLAMSTDGHTVSPLFFPGGDIGCLSVYGTVNDVAMLGARPRWLSAGFIIEEGLPLDALTAVVRSMADAAAACGVLIVGGDTKVVPRGACDQLFVTTTGLGEIMADPAPSGSRAASGDAILLSGPLGGHGLAVFGARQNLPFLSGISSDCGPVHHLVAALLDSLGPGGDIHVLRDPTRGGLATTLNEIATQSGVTCLLDETALPVTQPVRDGCSVLGLDPLYLANEGCLIAIVPERCAQGALSALHAAGAPEAVRIGSVATTDRGDTGGRPRVILTTALGGRRLLPMLEGEMLPRIC